MVEGLARRNDMWPCYHADLYCFELGEQTLGIVGRAVGAPSFAVLVAELFGSGCELLIRITSSGQIQMHGVPPYLVLIERSLCDEGTSYHYLPAAEWSTANSDILDHAERALTDSELRLERGASWTTDAPFRETAALYAFASARRKAVLCVAHVTNRTVQIEGLIKRITAALSSGVTYD